MTAITDARAAPAPTPPPYPLVEQLSAATAAPRSSRRLRRLRRRARRGAALLHRGPGALQGDADVAVILPELAAAARASASACCRRRCQRQGRHLRRPPLARARLPARRRMARQRRGPARLGRLPRRRERAARGRAAPRRPRAASPSPPRRAGACALNACAEPEGATMKDFPSPSCRRRRPRSPRTTPSSTTCRCPAPSRCARRSRPRTPPRRRGRRGAWWQLLESMQRHPRQRPRVPRFSPEGDGAGALARSTRRWDRAR